MTYHSSFYCEHCGHSYIIRGTKGIVTFLALRVWHKQMANHRLNHLVEVAKALHIVESL